MVRSEIIRQMYIGRIDKEETEKLQKRMKREEKRSTCCEKVRTEYTLKEEAPSVSETEFNIKVKKVLTIQAVHLVYRQN